MPSPMQIINELRACDNDDAREKVLLANKDSNSWTSVCLYTYCQMYSYPLRPSHLNCVTKADGASLESPNKLFELLRSSRRPSDALVATAKRYCAEHPNVAELVTLVLGRDLKCGIDANMLRRVYGGAFDRHDPDAVDTTPPDIKPGEWLATRHYPGVNLVALKHHRVVNIMGGKYLHREYKDACRLLENELIKVTSEMVLLGRVCRVDGDGKPHDKDMETLLDGEAIIEDIKFVAHDCLTIPSFCGGGQDDMLAERMKSAVGAIATFALSPLVQAVKYLPVDSNEHLDKLLAKAASLGWERLLLRRAGGYSKEHRDIVLEVPK
jgi:hypothetical protein